MDKIINQRSVISDETLSDSGFYWRERDDVKVLVCRRLEDAGFVNGFSTRLGGVSPLPESDLNLAGFDEDTRANIYENRRRFLNVFDAGFDLATVWQVHGDGVKFVETIKDAANSEEKFDALISKVPNLLVGVKTADCVPVLLGDPVNKTFAAVHAGWRGTVLSIAAKTIEEMKNAFGTNPADLVCAIGPAASCKSYEIGQDVIDAFNDNFSTSGKFFTPTRAGHALIDLHLANKDQLLGAGVSEANIFTAPFCTMERTDLFFSYRVEKELNGKTGRLMSVIGLGQNRLR
ncbi:MAG: peptidoglycan editing factor PgeF [Saprospiraceae bacterium]|nr:peptidoglycan editing factor PgeF [Pyrinomonadaceae bacterium]